MQSHIVSMDLRPNPGNPRVRETLGKKKYSKSFHSKCAQWLDRQSEKQKKLGLIFGFTRIWSQGSGQRFRWL